MKTFSANKNNIEQHWYCVDADNHILGRLASKLASFLRGKHKVKFTPHVDTGDFLIVLNASKIIVTGKKKTDKIYYHHTGYVGGIKKMSFREMMNRYPERVIEIAVKGMLPKGPLGRAMFRKLKVYATQNHTHMAQNPSFLKI